MDNNLLEELKKEEQRRIEQKREMLEKQQSVGNNPPDSKLVKVALLLLIPTFICTLFSYAKGVGLCFFLMGACIFLMPILKRIYMLKRCTEKIRAVCIDLYEEVRHEPEGGTSAVYIPKWEYSYDGKVYQQYEDRRTNVGVPNVGSERMIYVNPDDPNEIYRSNFQASIFTVIVGGAMAVVGFLLLIGVIGK